MQARKYPGTAIQTALYQRLTEDITDITIGDMPVPQGTAKPYIGIGDETATPDDTKTDTGDDTEVDLHVFSDGPGKKIAKQILARIVTAVFRAKLSLGVDFSHLNTTVTRNQVWLDEDGQTQHGLLTINIKTETK